MEDKEDPTAKTKARVQGKSGWMKKAHGRVLSSYKDRYISLDKTEIQIYESEDQKNCLEKVDLENYDKCHEMKSGFKKKHRLVVIRSAKSANKVQDLKFQAQSAEERDAWIRALSDAINRAKNKIFDEVKVDETSNLEHVTRTRPKGNRGRRPPTRIHLKEVADVSSDGILRLDLDLENAIMPNGTHSASSSVVDGIESQKKTSPSPSPGSSSDDRTLAVITESEGEDQMNVLKPPIAPAKPSSEDRAEEEEPEKKILKPPMPPSKDAKPSEPAMDQTPETSPNPTKKKIPPMPPNKPLSSLITPVESSPSKTPAQPPTPPCKEKKPSASVETNQESCEDMHKDEMEKTNPDLEDENQSQTPPATLAKSPKLPPKQQDLLDSNMSTLIMESEESKSDVPVVVVALKDSESANLSQFIGENGEDQEKKAEEKSLDSGQHSDDDGLEDSVSEDLTPTRDSSSDLDMLGGKTCKTEISISLKPQVVSSKGFTTWDLKDLKPPTPLKPVSKVRSASSGNLLCDRSDHRAASVCKLETEVALQMEDTGELLRGGKNPENLLEEAMEKLKKAELVLKEVKKLRPEKELGRRKSW